MGIVISACRQSVPGASEEKQSACNRETYGTSKYIEDFPDYLCIPAGNVIDDYVRVSDLNRDGNPDFLAVKYNAKEDYQKDGDTTYWQFYYKRANDSIYADGHLYINLVPPLIKDIGLEYLIQHPIASKINEEFPRRLSHALSFSVLQDTLTLSYKLDDTYGKSFVFGFNKESDDWTLQKVDYFMGELPPYWWRDDNFYYPLNDALKIIESRFPVKSIALKEFNLKEAFKYRDDEISHLKEQHIDQLKHDASQSILNVTFDTCEALWLPSGWVY
jgi:hypothetical protein